MSLIFGDMESKLALLQRYPWRMCLSINYIQWHTWATVPKLEEATAKVKSDGFRVANKQDQLFFCFVL